jgi:hypothetical protein
MIPGVVIAEMVFRGYAFIQRGVGGKKMGECSQLFTQESSE